MLPFISQLSISLCYLLQVWCLNLELNFLLLPVTNSHLALCHSEAFLWLPLGVFVSKVFRAKWKEYSLLSFSCDLQTLREWCTLFNCSVFRLKWWTQSRIFILLPFRLISVSWPTLTASTAMVKNWWISRKDMMTFILIPVKRFWPLILRNLSVLCFTLWVFGFCVCCFFFLIGNRYPLQLPLHLMYTSYTICAFFKLS